jgi:Ca-activated chloride channel family protein
MHRLSLASLALALVSRPLAAQGWIEIERPPVISAANPNVVRTSSEIEVALEGRAARVAVTERFRNDGGGLAEGSYLYPLPGEAVFQNFSLWMGDQELKGEMFNADQARGIYEEIVRRKRDPALLTMAGHGLVRAQVFPIQPGETRKVVLRYTQLLERSGDALRIRYALGARGGSSGTWRLTVPDEGRFGVPYSPTHSLTTNRHDGNLDISIETHDGGDIDLFLPLRRGLVGTTIETHADPGEDGYAMLLLAPAADAEGPVVPRDLTFVVDASGSMSGQKLQQAKAALHQALGTLRPEDRFRLIAFSSGVRQFRDGWAPMTAETRQEADRFIDALDADGGTNIAGALDAALGATVAESRLPIVFFLTDGVPSVGEQQPDRLASQAASRIGRARVFTVGVGHDVNTYLLDRLAAEGRGAAEYVPPEGSVEVAVGALIRKLSRPALVNLRIVESPVRFRDLSPTQLPDLFFGEELVVFGRYQGEGRGAVVIEGERNGRRERFTAEAVFPTSAGGNEYIPRLWASRRVGDLTRQIRLEGANQGLIDQVKELGLRYGILTEYTSYLVQEPDQVASNLPVEGRPRPDLRGQRDVAPAPAAQAGAAAFDLARQSGQMSKVATLAEEKQAAEDKLEAFGSGAKDLRRAGGRVFTERQGVWTDVNHRDSLRVVSVAPYSKAYFALIRALPELAPGLTLGDQVLVAGRRVSIKFTTAGRETLSESEIRDLTRAFRGV